MSLYEMYRSIFLGSLLLLSLLLKEANADPVSEAQWWVNIAKANNGKSFCLPSKMTLNELVQAVQRERQSKGLPDSTSEQEVLTTLGRLYPCGTQKVDAAARARIKNVINDPKALQSVVAAAKKCVVFLKNPCPSATFTITNITLLKELTFNDGGAISGGAWKYAIQENGCGVSRVLNVLAVVPKPQTLSTAPLLPGTSHADPILQKDAVLYAEIAAGAPEKDCDSNFIEQTEFLKFGGAPLEGAKGSPWDELWTLRGCTRRAQVVMHFIPDRTGTTISTTKTETKFLPIKRNEGAPGAQEGTSMR
jgi:hypothetical protein